MALIDRAKNILLTPKTEWPTIATETATVASLYTGYIMLLAAIGPIAILVRGQIGAAIIGYVVALVVTYALALIVDALAPRFGGERNLIGSLKLTAYSYTAAWVAGIFNLIPTLGTGIGILAMIYSFYTFYLGLPALKKCPPEKAIAYTIVVVLCGFLLGGVLGTIALSVLNSAGPGNPGATTD